MAAREPRVKSNQSKATGYVERPPARGVFGGIGHSGMGSYHGIEGFRELSHARTVFKRHRFFPIDLFYPPYGNFVQCLFLRLWLGKGDASLEKQE